MRLPAILSLLLGMLLIALGRHLIRRARKIKRQNPAIGTRRRLAGWGGWGLTVLGFLAMLLGVMLW